MKVALDAPLSEPMSIEVFGPLSKATKIHIKYNDQNILCLEKLQVESLDKSLQFNLIQVTNTTSKHCDRLLAKKKFVLYL